MARIVERNKAEKKAWKCVGNLMDRYKVLGFVVIAGHWAAAVWHLFLTPKVLPSPGNNVNLFALGMLSLVHLAVCVVWWKVSNRPAGLILSTFFIVVLAFGVYVHFLHPGANNVFMVLPGEWRTLFLASVGLLTGQEILGAGIGFWSLKGQGQLRGLPLTT